jgi:hypothetical protein
MSTHLSKSANTSTPIPFTQHDMEVPIRTTRSLFADGNPVGRGSVAFGMDGYIIPVGPTTLMKILRLDATILPDQSLEPKKDNI